MSMSGQPWTIGPLRRFARIVNGGTPSPDGANWDGGVPWATPVDLNSAHGGDLKATGRSLTHQGATSGSTIVPARSVILSTRAPIGYVATTDMPMAFNQGCKAVVPGPVLEPRFLRSLLVAAGAELHRRGQGTTFLELSAAALASLPVAVPSRAYQVLVADYLDRETAEIDAFIADQEKLIELLTERRAATINRVARKPQASETPKTESLEIFREDDWKSRRLKTLASIRYGLGEPPPYVDDGVPLIRATNVRSGSITSVGLVFVRPEDIPARRILWLHEGDLVVVRSGATTGDAALVEGEFAGSIAGFDMVVRPVTSVEPRFLKYVLLSADVRRGQIELLRARAAQPHLNAEELGDLEIAIPSLSEQRRIADELDLQTSTIDSTIADAREAIALSKERRTALISAAVTGKIDVGEPGKVNA